MSDQLGDPIRSGSAPSELATSDGRTDSPAITATDHDADSIISKLPLDTVDAKSSQVAQIRQEIIRVLRTGVAPGALLKYLTAKVKQARTVKYVLTSLSPEHTATLADSEALADAVVVPPVCGRCDARDGDGLAARTITHDGKTYKCPSCHPYSNLAAPLPVA